MPIVPQPNIIELSDFSAGWLPDLEESTVPMTGLLSAKNLLPNIGTHALVARKGFKRVATGLPAGYRVLSLHVYNRVSGTTTGRYLIAVMSTGADNVADNLRVYALNLSTGAYTRISPVGRTWVSGNARHWGATINNIFYGGGIGDKMYKWDPDGGWDSDPSVQNFKTWIGANNATNLATERPGDAAFERGDQVLFDDGLHGVRAYSADRDIKFRQWKVDEEYEKGDRVSVSTQHPTSTLTYLRSYRCIKKHTSVVGNKPGAGTGHWERIQLGKPADDDNNIGRDWNLIPLASQTNIATWHGNRLFMRYDTVGPTGKTRVLYSAPSRFVRGTSSAADVSQVTWDPKDFRLGVKDGEGGGWLPDQPDEVTALFSYGYYLLIFMRGQTKVLAGTNESTWVFRPLSSSYGAIGPRAVTEHEGLVYFVSDKGLYLTDGTEVREVEGAENIREWLRNAVNWETTGGRENDVILWSYGGFLWFAVPTGSDRLPDRVVAYDTNTKSFWPQDLAPSTVAVNRIDGVEQMFFTEPTQVGAAVGNVYAWSGAAKRSQSTRTLPTALNNLWAASGTEPVRVNRCPICSIPRMGTQTPKEVKADLLTMTQPMTSMGKTGYSLSPQAARRGSLGIIVEGETSPQFTTFGGVRETFSDIDGTTHTLSAFVRRPDWHHRRKVVYEDVHFAVGVAEISNANTHFNYVGRGWWRVDAQYAGSVTARDHVLLVRAGSPGYFFRGDNPESFVSTGRGGLTLHIDGIMAHKGSSPVPYFNGDGGDDVGTYTRGGDTALVYQYDHPGSRGSDVDGNLGDTDDTGVAGAYDSTDVAWGMRTAWLPFGVLREERRIRRIWGLVRGHAAVTLQLFRNFRHAPAGEVETGDDDTRPVWHAEGQAIPDSFAVSVGVDGVGAPAAVLGVSLETQPRRVRYHT